MSTVIAPPFTDPEQAAKKVQMAEDIGTRVILNGWPQRIPKTRCGGTGRSF
jgi:hypothetical protein